MTGSENATEVDPILRPRHVAVLLGICTSTLKNWDKRQVGPRRIRLTARNVGYKLSEVQRFLAAREQAAGAPRV